MQHAAITPEEAGDRLAIRELIDAYAHCADTRDAEGQKALFTDDTHFVVYMDGEGTAPTQEALPATSTARFSVPSKR